MRAPLSGKTDWVDYTGTSVVKAVMGGRSNLVELDVSGHWTLHFATWPTG